jgi:hypothetical protein
MVDNNSGNDDTNKNKDADKVGKLSDGLLRLVEEDDGKGNVCYCVESVSNDELLYSSHSKPQAFSYVEGYRARDGEGDSKTRKPKADDNSDKGDNDSDSKAKPTQTVDPAKVQRKRAVI